MAISLEKADEYFSPGNHSQAELWRKFTAQHRAGAIAEAKRELERDLARTLAEPVYTPVRPLMRRDDYAVYEQALWLLLSTPVGDASQGDAIAVLTGGLQSEGGAAKNDGAHPRERFSPEALRWLGWGGVVTVRA